MVTIPLERRTHADSITSKGVRGLGRWAGFQEQSLVQRTAKSIAFTAENGTLTVEVRDRIPNWLIPVGQRFAEVLALKPGWNSYKAKPVAFSSIVAALHLLSQAMQENSPVPHVVPTARGTIQLEWHLPGVELEVDVLGNGRAAVLYERTGAGEPAEEWDDELRLSDPRLARIIGGLPPTA